MGIRNNSKKILCNLKIKLFFLKVLRSSSLVKCSISHLKQFSLVPSRFELPKESLREKCPNTQLFLVRIFPYSVQIRGNTDQK